MNSPEQTPEIMCIHNNTIANLNNPTTDTKITLFVHGEVDPLTIPQLKYEVMNALDRAESVDLDMYGVSYLGAAGLNSLDEACTIAQRQNRTITIKNPSKIVQRLMAITGLDQTLPIEYDQQ